MSGRSQPRRSAVASGAEENVRMERFDAALSKFLELLDERATESNFQVALPHLDQKLLESARQQFVFHLKDAIKMEKDRLVQSYSLSQRLAELEDLTREADGRNEEARRKGVSAALLHRDAWRPGIDLDTAVNAPLISQSKRQIDALENELREIEKENEREENKLAQTMQEESRRREDARLALDSLEETLKALEATTEEDDALSESVTTLLAELGPRGIV